MKLKNKKTGEIGEVGYISTTTGDIIVSNINDQEEWYHYKSLAALNAEWEDVPEEPKSINGIDIALDAIGEYCNEHSYYSGDSEKIKILNAVEDKLKAWKRLKDKGFKFNGWENDKEHCLGDFIIHSEIKHLENSIFSI